MMDNKHFEVLLRDVIKTNIDTQTVPSDVKERVIEKIHLSKSETHNRISFKIVACTVAMLLLFITCAYFAYPQQAGALSVGLIERLEFFLQEKLYNISESFSNKSETKDPPPQTPEIPSETEVSLQEARASLPFSLSVPQYIPKGLVMEKVKLSGEKPLMEVTLRYTGENKNLIIVEKGISENAGIGLSYDKDDTKVKSITVRGCQANLLVNKSNWVLLEWHDQIITYIIQGNLPPEEIVNIANKLTTLGT